MNKNDQKLRIVILAAGLGKRMRSRQAKVLHPVCGRPMLHYVLQASRKLNPEKVIVVIGNQADKVKETLAGEKIYPVLQKKQFGTAHAVLQAEKELQGFRGILLVLNGDLPLITAETLKSILKEHRKSGADLSVMTTIIDDPEGYGRVIREGNGSIRQIVEERDATMSQREIKEISCGIYCAKAKPFLAALKRVRTNNVQQEYYITDAVRIMLGDGKKVSAFLYPESGEVLGVNTRYELCAASKLMNRKTLHRLMESGVSILDPEITFIESDIPVGRDTVIYPNVYIEGKTRIGKGCRIFPGCHIVDSVILNGAWILNNSVITRSRVGKNARIGPFAHLRPESDIGEDARIGNFVEVKKSKIGRGTKASHLTYLGDATIGEKSNIGAGTITCNYDGFKKHRTTLGKKVFVGSDVQFIAPVTIGDGAYIGAGSTITEDVPKHSLAIARARQSIKKNWTILKKKFK
ncbi:MAG: bifunctional UDP-N-acetylglucosamine diphosphorylase/glucosamine-1-phosphate N-acetyltransferase GlmU [Acidobacteriota bacterium]